MKLKLIICDHVCAPEEFTINGISANAEDFGMSYDCRPDWIEAAGFDYGCGFMKFFKKPATEDILKRYNISPTEYDEVCNNLEEKLTFGTCNLCVSR